MRAYAFVGPSGTGKSHRAAWLAKERGIGLIIDDGLLICGNRVLAGSSAKKERTKLRSVRKAIFTDPVHAGEVAAALRGSGAESVLILGTSEGMAEIIAERLGVGPIAEFILIGDVATEAEISQALTTRREHGKHVIPVPSFEIKKDFSGYSLDPLRVFRRRPRGSMFVEESSVVRPTFSYLGSYTISDYAVFQIIDHVASGMESIAKVARFKAESHFGELRMEIDLTLYYGYAVMDELAKARKAIRAEVERLTALNVSSVAILARSIVPRKA
ncbi:MAG: hypothetical protein FWE70_06935 [Oscillospiraceae bacterium]|nr:hypothetical protein [Oscillospiraceae bacterium]